MRFFSLALPVFMGLFVAASPVAVDAGAKALAARQEQLDLASTLNGLQGKIAEQGDIINQDPTDEQNVAGGLSVITDLLEEVLSLLESNGANTDPSSIDAGGLLGGLLGGGGAGADGVTSLLGLKKRQNLDVVGTALQGVLTQLNVVVAGLPAATIALPLVGPLVTALTPLLLQLVAGVNSLVPGIINLVKTLLITVSGLLLQLSSVAPPQ